jgi:hypothetical protein
MNGEANACPVRLEQPTLNWEPADGGGGRFPACGTVLHGSAAAAMPAIGQSAALWHTHAEVNALSPKGGLVVLNADGIHHSPQRQKAAAVRQPQSEVMFASRITRAHFCRSLAK